MTWEVQNLLHIWSGSTGALRARSTTIVQNLSVPVIAENLSALSSAVSRIITGGRKGEGIGE